MSVSNLQVCSTHASRESCYHQWFAIGLATTFLIVAIAVLLAATTLEAAVFLVQAFWAWLPFWWPSLVAV
jgi:hypothetical protein